MLQLPNPTEGYSSEKQRLDISLLIKKYVINPNYIFEIGFNGGHSSDSFLRYNPNCKVVSFDIGEHSYVTQGKSYIDHNYPNRHELILGNSEITIPAYDSLNKFDVIFIDGGHKYPTPKNDLENCKRFAHKNTLVIMDDIPENFQIFASFQEGPVRSWKEAVESGFIKQLGTIHYENNSGMAFGRYIF